MLFSGNIPVMMNISPDARAMYVRFFVNTNISIYVIANNIIAANKFNHPFKVIRSLDYISLSLKSKD